MNGKIYKHNQQIHSMKSNKTFGKKIATVSSRIGFDFDINRITIITLSHISLNIHESINHQRDVTLRIIECRKTSLHMRESIYPSETVTYLICSVESE